MAVSPTIVWADDDGTVRIGWDGQSTYTVFDVDTDETIETSTDSRATSSGMYEIASAVAQQWRTHDRDRLAADCVGAPPFTLWARPRPLWYA